MIIADAHGVGTELGLWPTLTRASSGSLFPAGLIIIHPDPPGRGRIRVHAPAHNVYRVYRSQPCVRRGHVHRSGFFLEPTRMRDDEIDDLVGGLLDGLPRDIHHRPAIHLAQT
jgi:hypothetical protein